MDVLHPHDSLRGNGASLRARNDDAEGPFNNCLVPYTLQPFEALTQEDKPLKGLGHRGEPFEMERRARVLSVF